ncbi:MAG: VRR-NUC domain-containing protein [Nitrospinota bacterium]|nr:VRR-NUC domain-containing protein [Nitrospinota bacterium]
MRNDLEHQHQVALINWASAHENKYPGLHLLHAIPNGGHRNKATAGKLKAEGVKAGFPDLLLPVPRGEYHSLYIEMKKPVTRSSGKGSISKAQSTVIEELRSFGNAVVVCYGWIEASQAIIDYYKGAGR